MNVRTLCLAVLVNRDASGYEIRKLCTEESCSLYLDASYSAIYPALAKLEEEQLVTSRVELQDGKPAKKIYSITKAGKDKLLEAMFEPLEPDVFKSEFLLFLQLAPQLPRSLVEERIAERIVEYRRKSQELDALVRNNSHAPEAWLARFGRDNFEFAASFFEEHKHELINSALADGGSVKAAAE